MKTVHTFLTKAHDIRSLYAETTTLKEFCKKLEAQSQKVGIDVFININ